MIPNIIHFTFGFREDFGGKPFSFIHYLAVKSAHDRNRPEAIKFYYQYEPSGEWWEKSKPYLTLIRIEPPAEVFGNKLYHFAHQSDVLRLQILIREGGIYLDLDMICLNSFEPLRKFSCVLGRESSVGLCNAVMMAEPGAPFLKRWLETYRSFRSKGHDEFWSEHSVDRPMQLAAEHPEEIHIEDDFAFFWPWINQAPLLFRERKPAGKPDLKHAAVNYLLSKAYAMHLWETLWWDAHLRELSPDTVLNKHTAFAAVCRRILSETKDPQSPGSGQGRGLVKALIFLIRAKRQIRIALGLMKRRVRRLFHPGEVFLDELLERLDQDRSLRKIELGSSVPGGKGWKTVDLRGTPDIREDILNMDRYCEDDSVDVFYLSHTYEHLPLVQLDVWIKKLLSKLKKNGRLIVVHTDIKGSLELYKRGKIDFFCLRDIIMSPIAERKKSFIDTGQDLFHHQFMWGPEELSRELLHYGFSRVERINARTWAFDVRSEFPFQENEKYFGVRIPNLGLIAYK